MNDNIVKGHLKNFKKIIGILDKPLFRAPSWNSAGALLFTGFYLPSTAIRYSYTKQLTGEKKMISHGKTRSFAEKKKGCTSPYAPEYIKEMVSRKQS